MAKVLPTLREKKRYLIFEVIGSASCEDAAAAIKGSFSSLFGVLAASSAAIRQVKSKGKRCMVSVSRKHVDRFKAAMIMVKSIKSSEVVLHSVGVSGSVKGAATKYLSNAGGM